MIQRFQIEDLVIQDASGVVFRALDTETNQTVAVRRFFPFGADGGGLRDDEQVAYNVATGRLAAISHPALRAVICGGCDPVDGMPYIATEWIDGLPLESFIRPGLVEPAAAANVLLKALEVCELLSDVLAEEAVWVETSLQAIVVGAEGTGRGVTFWIAPLKWLGKNDGHRSLESIITLTEEIMGWTGKSVSDQADHGLEGWLKWLRGKAQTTTLREAREMLAAFIGAEPPASAEKPATRAAVPVKPLRPTKPIKQSKPKTLLIGSLALALILAGSGGWMWIRKNPDSHLAQLVDTKPSASPEMTTVLETILVADATVAEPTPSEEQLRPRANQTGREEIVRSDTKPESKETAPPPPTAASAAVIPWTQHDLLVQKDGEPVVVEGVVVEIQKAKSGDVVYLYFAGKADRNAARAAIEVPVAEADGMTAKLEPFRGKKVRVTGTVRHLTLKGLSRPDIVMNDSSAVSLSP